LNTDFTDLLNQICENYLRKDPIGIENPQKLPPFNLVVISDLLHDVKNKLKNEYHGQKLSEKIRKDRKELNGLIRRALDNKLLVNVIILKAAREMKPRKYETSIWDTLKERRNQHKAKMISIDEYHNKYLLRAVEGENIINFNFSGSSHHINSIFRIKLNKLGTYNFGLDYEESSSEIPEGDLKFRIVDSQNIPVEEKNKSGYLLVDREIIDHFKQKELVLDGRQKIELIYSGELPLKRKLPDFKISIPGEVRAYYTIPIYFTKNFSSLNKWFFGLIYIMWLLFIIWLIGLLAIKIFFS
jgi:hypothetical protein